MRQEGAQHAHELQALQHRLEEESSSGRATQLQLHRLQALKEVRGWGGGRGEEGCGP